MHVVLPDNAPFCAAFLKGYCAAGVKCASKHFTLKQIKEERKLVAGRDKGKRSQGAAVVAAAEREAAVVEKKKKQKSSDEVRLVLLSCIYRVFLTFIGEEW